MEISFGAKLITNPSQFMRKTDTPAQCAKIEQVFKEIGDFLSAPRVDRISSQDTVEILRKPAKTKFHYRMNYSSPNLKETLPINMHVGTTPDDFRSFDAIHQLTHVHGYLTGKKPHLAESFKQYFRRVYDLPKKTD